MVIMKCENCGTETENIYSIYGFPRHCNVYAEDIVLCINCILKPLKRIKELEKEIDDLKMPRYALIEILSNNCSPFYAPYPIYEHNNKDIFDRSVKEIKKTFPDRKYKVFCIRK